MRHIIPSHLDTQLYNSLRSLAEAVERQEIKLGTVQTVRNLKDGDFAFITENGNKYFYTKSDGKVFRILFLDEDGDETTEQRTFYSSGLESPFISSLGG